MNTKHRRNSHHFWTPFAWAVRALVERGYGATESARAVLARGGVEVTKENVACVRVVYYRIRGLMWPPEMAAVRGGVVKDGVVQGPTVAESPEPRNLRMERMMAKGVDTNAEDVEPEPEEFEV